MTTFFSRDHTTYNKSISTRTGLTSNSKRDRNKAETFSSLFILAGFFSFCSPSCPSLFPPSSQHQNLCIFMFSHANHNHQPCSLNSAHAGAVTCTFAPNSVFIFPGRAARLFENCHSTASFYNPVQLIGKSI